MSDNLGALTGANPMGMITLPGANPLNGIELSGETTKIDLPDGASIEVDSAVAAMVKSVSLDMTVTRADGTVEILPTLKTEYAPAA